MVYAASGLAGRSTCEYTDVCLREYPRALAGYALDCKARAATKQKRAYCTRVGSKHVSEPGARCSLLSPLWPSSLWPTSRRCPMVCPSVTTSIRSLRCRFTIPRASGTFGPGRGGMQHPDCFAPCASLKTNIFSMGTTGNGFACALVGRSAREAKVAGRQATHARTHERTHARTHTHTHIHTCIHTTCLAEERLEVAAEKSLLDHFSTTNIISSDLS